MNEKHLFESNNVDETVNQIQKVVEEGNTVFVLFPLYYPKLNLNTEYDVIGKTENQLLISKKLKEKNVDSIRIEETSFFIFFSNNISEKEKKEIEKEASSIAYWHDIID
ncbi:MAG: hypothetical protein K6B70_02035 [Clostridia bacterium]|nr:hypothetical protein [Clostridia bacterium]